jgi:hypothetical protein
MRGRPLLKLLLALSLGASGCFQYVPVEGVPPQGTPVRAGLSRPVAIELSDLTANNIVEVRGEIVAGQSEEIVLSAFALRAANEFEYPGRGQTVSLPRDAVARLEQKRISVSRTALATAGLVGLGYLVQLALKAVGGGGGGDPGGPPSK